MKQFIKDVLVELHSKVTTDQYGQVPKFYYVPSAFGDRADEVEKYCNENKGILEFSTYGNSYQTYTAFTIVDADIRMACKDALRKNPNYLHNINSW